MDNGQEPATKQDVAEVRQELGEVRQGLGEMQQGLGEVQQGLAEVRQGLAMSRSEMNHQFDDLKEAFRDSQTELLKAFYAFTESNRQRVAQVEGNQGSLIIRVGVLEERILHLERKVNFPNHPPQ